MPRAGAVGFEGGGTLFLQTPVSVLELVPVFARPPFVIPQRFHQHATRFRPLSQRSSGPLSVGKAAALSGTMSPSMAIARGPLHNGPLFGMPHPVLRPFCPWSLEPRISPPPAVVFLLVERFPHPPGGLGGRLAKSTKIPIIPIYLYSKRI